MEEDINIYTDLPNFNLTESDINDQPKADHVCNCEESEKKFNSLTNEFENMKKVNENLEKNLASLLKTAKAEIARKDKMIEELRNQLDNVAFRRNKNRSLEFSTLRSSHNHNTVAAKYESVTSIMDMKEDAFMPNQIEPSYTEYKSKKPQNNTDQPPVTVFGERLHKRIMDDKREEKKLRALSKLSSETNMNKISEECIVESDKENGSQSSINNNANESNVIRSSNSDTSYKKNPGKRSKDEKDDTCKSKRLKPEDNEDRNDNDIQCNSMAQYDTKSDLKKLEDQLCVMYSIKNEQVAPDTKRRATSEYGDAKQTQNYRNEWKKEERNSVTKDCDDACTRKGSVDSSRSRTASISSERLNSEHQHDHYINGYRKNDYRRGSSSSRSSFKSRSDYESSSSHRLWEKPSRTYRDRKYDDYKYDGRHKNDRSRRGYDSKETSDVRTRYNSRERGDLRDKLRHTMSEERRSRSGSYKSNKYDNYRLKETTANVSEDKRSYKGDKAVAEIDSRASSSRTVVNTIVDHNVGKNAEQHSTKNKPHTSMNFVESTSTCVIKKDKSHLEEGEILDSPEKKHDSVKNSTAQAMEENVAKISIQTERTSGNTLVDIQGNTKSTSDRVKNNLTQLSPAGERISMTAEMCFHNFAVNDLHSDKIIIYPCLPSPEIIGGCNNNCDGDYECENCVDENVGDDTVNRPVEGIYDFNNKNITRSEEVSNAASTIEVGRIGTMFASSLPPNDKNIHQVDYENVVSSTLDEVTQIKIVPNCNNIDGSQVFNGNETFRQIPDNNNAEASHTCLGDHNYVRDIVIDASNLNAIPSSLERCESVSNIATSKENKAEETINIQSADTRKTMSTTVKSKKDENSKAVVILRRRKAVTLSDNNASMTVLISTDSVGSSLPVDNSASDKSDTVSKPRACKLARTMKPPCK